jgi:hypothetical protein
MIWVIGTAPYREIEGKLCGKRGKIGPLMG